MDTAPVVSIVGLITLMLILAAQILFGSLIGAVILRAAVSAFNRMTGKRAPEASNKPPIAEPVGPAIPRQVSDSPYQAPSAYAAPTQITSEGVIVPRFGKAFLTCLAANGVTVLAGLLIGMVVGITAGMTSFDLNGESTERGLQLTLLAISVIGLVGAIKIIFPTTFPRSFAIAGIFLLISIGILIFIVLGLGLVFGVLGGVG